MKNFYKNEYLFSEIYLREITQIEEDPAVKATLSVLKEYREYAVKSGLEAWNTSFVHEILNALRFGVRKIGENTALLYQLGSDSTTTLCYSLLPSESLDSTAMGRNWAEKTIRKLRNNQLKWGILTNGDRWRIYHTEESAPYENYLEIDLKKIMDGEDVQQYQIFNKFMKAENFLPDKEGKCQFDIFKKESQDRINYIEEELRNALKQTEEGGKGILSNLCMGYVEYLREEENPDFSDALCSTIYGGAMLYMFRLLFLFYAKARGLLKEANHELFSNVLLAAQKAQEQGNTGEGEYSLWTNLRELFSNIDLTYNGGLFNPAENEFIEEQRISNIYLAPVLYYMTFYNDKAGIQKPISYRDMAVRHLGSLYEGLLEHKLFIAEEDTEVKFTKKEIEFISASKGGKIVTGKFIPSGQVYFGNDKGIRKASGSYYTPEYIVDYIVKNTVGRKLDELKEIFLGENRNTIDSLKIAIDESEKMALANLLSANIETHISEKVLKLSVLDPAMGSGHFLLNATNLISNFLTEFSNDFNVISDNATKTSYWRRRVVENCIYGVDINPLAVELAKLSLWILSMAKKQPLSFLDHHLKCGDSLIGSTLSEIGDYPLTRKKRHSGSSQFGLFENSHDFQAAVKEAVNKYDEIQSKESKEIMDIESKKEWLNRINDVLKLYRSVCNFHADVYFSDISQEQYEFRTSKFSSKFLFRGKTYFHWELEYPMILLRGKYGFDVILGNPPWVSLSGKFGSDTITESEKNYLNNNFNSNTLNSNLYEYFSWRSLQLICSNGLFAFIVPDRLGFNKQFTNFRKHILENYKIILLNYKAKFPGIIADTLIFVFEKDRQRSYEFLVGEFEKGLSRVNIKEYFENTDYCFSYQTDKNIAQAINAIDSIENKMLLSEAFSSTSGFGGKSKTISERRESTNQIEIIKGKNVQKYHLNGKLYFEFVKENITGRTTDKNKLGAKEKILLRKTGYPIPATYDDSGIFPEQSLYFLFNKKCTESYLYFLGIINSKLFQFYYWNKLVTNRDSTPQLKKIHLDKFPFPNVTNSLEKKSHDAIVSLVQTMLKMRKELYEQNGANENDLFNEKRIEIEHQINKITYDLYKLKRSEIEIIEGDE